MRRIDTPSRVRGFTLLEVLISLSIFAVLAVVSYSGLTSVLDLQFHTKAEAEQLARLQKAYQVMQRDIEQVVARPVRDEFGDELAPLVGGSTLELTRGGWSNPLGQPRSTLQRVAYVFEDSQLQRYVWMVLDRAQDSQPLKQLILDNVEHMQLRYLLAPDEWQGQWPMQVEDSGLNIADEAPVVLPAAVEVTIEHEYYGPLVWLFQVAQ